MIRDPNKLAKMLTRAQQSALINAVSFDENPALAGRFYPRLRVRMDVRSRLQTIGLLSVRPGHYLTRLGEQVREALLREYA